MRHMTIEELEKAVASLPADQLERFRVWFEAARFDERIACDAASGRFDLFAEQALADHRQGLGREH